VQFCGSQKIAQMAGKTITMSKVKQIILLRNNGIGLKTIAKAVGVSRNTVKKYLRLIEVKGYNPLTLLSQPDHQVEALFAEPDPVSQDRYKALEAMFPYIQSELKRTGVNRWLLWGEYKQKHPDGYSYAHFCAYLRTWMQEQSATMHFEHEPGDRLYIDFAGKKLLIVDKETGELKNVEVYVATLGYSQLTYVEAVVSQKKEDFILATENALHFFGGVPSVVVPDNLKSAVHRAHKYEAELNESFRDFANHYQTSILPARSNKPRDKSPVEKAIDIIYTRIYAPLRNQVFYTIEELNKAIAELLEAHNLKHFQREPISRREKFEQHERNTLSPLPSQQYEIKQYKWVKAMKNCHVHLSEDKHYYSFPYRYIGRKVKLIYTATTVSIFYNKQRIAFHKRDRKRFGYTTVKEHLPSTHQFVSEWNPDKFIRWASAIDEKVKDYIVQILESKAYPEQAYRSCVGILSQEKKFGRERFIKAVERASYYQAYNYKIVERILKGKLEMLDLPGQVDKQKTLPFHKNTRGADYYN
jgi:transposase